MWTDSLKKENAYCERKWRNKQSKSAQSYLYLSSCIEYRERKRERDGFGKICKDRLILAFLSFIYLFYFIFIIILLNLNNANNASPCQLFFFLLYLLFQLITFPSLICPFFFSLKIIFYLKINFNIKLQLLELIINFLLIISAFAKVFKMRCVWATVQVSSPLFFWFSFFLMGFLLYFDIRNLDFKRIPLS